MNKYYIEKEIPEGYEARIEGNKIILEPKESDDERIMKDIITALSIGVACDESALYPEATTTLKEAIAYLEKQKNFQFGYPGLYFYDGEKLHFQGNPAMEENPYDFAMSQQDEQKPAEWSEEDKEMLFFLNEFMDNKGKDYFSTLVYPKIKIWLKSLPERFNLQPKQERSEKEERLMKALQTSNARIAELVEENYNLKETKQEWSEEDETALGDLMWCIEKARKSAKDENDMGNVWFAENWVKNRLKSIRQQPHWKPSKEQMEAVFDASERNDKLGFVLRNLYNDLKKL